MILQCLFFGFPTVQKITYLKKVGEGEVLLVECNRLF